MVYTASLRVGGPTGLGVTLFSSDEWRGARFRLWAPYAREVVVRLLEVPEYSLHTVLVSEVPEDSFQRFSLFEEPRRSGYWIVDIDGVSAGDLYQFLVTNRGGDKYNPDGTPLTRTDPCARQVTSSDPMLLSFVVDPTAFTFTDTQFRTPPFENFILYQAHVGSFAGRNDGMTVHSDASGGTATFRDVEAKLDYIASMHFNAIQFLPNGEYNGTESVAYNPSNYYAPEVLYGFPDDLRHLVDACHQRGLAVFFDVVYNHMDSTHNLWQFDGNNDHRTDENDPATGGGIYFSTVETGFGRRPDHDSPDVQRFFYENAEMWFREYHVDGLRFDSVVNFSEKGLYAIVQRLRADFPDKFIYAESGSADYVFQHIGFCACWDLESVGAFAHCIGSGDLTALQNLIGHYGYPNAYSAIKYFLGSHDQIFNQWEYNTTAHAWQWDKPGSGGLRENRYFVERIGGEMTGRDNWVARAQSRLGWALNVAIPCTPMLFMGSECYHNGYWNPKNDPFGDHRFDWSIAGDPLGWEMRRLVGDVNALRWNHSALRSDILPVFTHIDNDNHVLAFMRQDSEGDVLLIVVNLSDHQWDDPVYALKVGKSGEHWTEIFNSQSPQYGGWSDSGNYNAVLITGDDGTFSIRLPQWSVLIFQQH